MKLRLIFVLLLLAPFSCKHKDDLVRPPATLQSGSMNVGKAQAHFSKYDSLMRLHAHTRAEGSVDSSLYPGIFTPKWGDAVESASKDRSSVESDISATNYFIAKWNDGVVTVKQRLIVLQVGDNVQMGIETIIPTVDFQTKYPDYYTHYVNNGNRTFSGMVLFHTISGNFSQIVYLHNGRRLASYYTPELTEQNLAQVKQRVGYIMGSLKLRLVSTAATRVGDDIDGGWIEAVGITVCRICLKRDLQCVCRPKEFPYVNWEDNSCDVDRGDSGGGGGGNASDEMWSEEMHNKLIGNAFKNILNAQQRIMMQVGSEYADTFQGPEYNHIHAQRTSGETVEQAVVKMEQFFVDNVQSFLQTGSYHSLGMAFHSIMDAYCPPHQLISTFDGGADWFKHWCELAGESMYLKDIANATEAMKRLYELLRQNPSNVSGIFREWFVNYWRRYGGV